MRLMPFIEKTECILHFNACLDEFFFLLHQLKVTVNAMDLVFFLFFFLLFLIKFYLQILLRPKTYEVSTLD